MKRRSRKNRGCIARVAVNMSELLERSQGFNTIAQLTNLLSRSLEAPAEA